MKHCGACNSLKPLTAFAKCRTTRDGLQTQCKACKQLHNRQWYAANSKAHKASRDRWYAEHKALRRKTQQAWAEANQESTRAARERYKANNPGAAAAGWAARRAAVGRSTPPWADSRAIAEVYRQAQELRNLGLDVHVDHIVPLRGKNVSGLHVHYNLQVLLADDNLKKSNNF